MAVSAVVATFTISLYICSVPLASPPPQIFSYLATAGFAAIA
jgi:hypothetical protein